MAFDAKVRKWGNSLGIVLPAEFVSSQGLRENDVIYVQIVKKANLEKSFGILKTKMTGQQFKDMVRKGWES